MTFVYFSDRDLGNRFPEILRSHGVRVEPHKDHFAHNTPDEEWLEVVSRRGWIALTHNHRIRYTPNELDAVIRHRVSLLILIGKAPLADLANSFVLTLPRVERFIQGQSPPFIAKVYRPTPAELARRRNPPGRIELWYP